MRFLRPYRFFLLLMVLVQWTACSSYEELIIENKAVLSGESSGYNFTDASDEKKPEFKSARPKNMLTTSVKYLSRINGFTPEAKIMNTGVEETLKGNYIEAEILFNEIHGIINDGSVENNLAVIFELTKRKKEAMEMYTTAYIKSPENSQFKSNLLSFINHNKFKAEK